MPARKKRGRMTPEVAESWQRVFREFAITFCAAFCFVFGPVFESDNPTALGLILTAGAALFGGKMAASLDRKARLDRNGGDDA